MAPRSIKVGTALTLVTTMIVVANAAVEMRYLGNITDAYTIGDKIGSGSYGIVYRAHPIGDPDMLVAIKELKHMSYELEERFQTTIGAANEIPGIPRVYDLVKTETQKFYVVMQLFVGDRISEVPVTPALVSSIIRRLFKTAKILKELHDRNVLHNDISSRNVLFDNNENVMVIDFGFSYCTNSRPTWMHDTEGLLCRCCPRSAGVLTDSYDLGLIAREWHGELSSWPGGSNGADESQHHNPMLKKLNRFIELTTDYAPKAWSCEKLLENLNEFELDDDELDLNMVKGSKNLKYFYHPDDVVAATKNRATNTWRPLKWFRCLQYLDHRQEVLAATENRATNTATTTHTIPYHSNTGRPLRCCMR